MHDPLGWSASDIELELGCPVPDAPRLIAVHDLHRRVDAVRSRLQALAREVERVDAAAQYAIIERGADPRVFDLDPDTPV